MHAAFLGSGTHESLTTGLEWTEVSTSFLKLAGTHRSIDESSEVSRYSSLVIYKVEEG